MSLIEELLEEIIRVAKLQALYYNFDSRHITNLIITDALNRAKQSIINNNTIGMLEALDGLKQFED